MNIDWFRLPKQRSHHTVGRVLSVGLPELGIDMLTAKVDTGAFSGSLHATKIHEIGTGKHKQLQFVPLGGTNKPVVVDTYHRRSVKSSNGQVSQRYAFQTSILIMGQSYPIVISLTDRSSMKFQMLIGRKFLQTHGFLVDVSLINQ